MTGTVQWLRVTIHGCTKEQLINPPALPSVAADAASVYSLTLVQPPRHNLTKGIPASGKREKSGSYGFQVTCWRTGSPSCKKTAISRHDLDGAFVHNVHSVHWVHPVRGKPGLSRHALSAAMSAWSDWSDKSSRS